MQKELTSEQNQYIQERGFEVVDGRPTAQEPFPYVTLREPQAFSETSEMTYHKTQGSSIGTMGVAHPSTTSNDELVDLIESSVGGSMALDGELFQTKPGQPIKVFVIDPAWKEVADTLAVKYK